MEHLFGSVLCIVCGVFLGIGIYSYMGNNKEVEEQESEIGFCHIKDEVYCINGELLVKNPRYTGSMLISGDMQSLFLDVIGRRVTPCTCLDSEVKENSELLTDLKKTVDK